MTTTSSSSSIHPSSTTNSTPSANGSTFSASSKEPIIHPVWEAGTSTWQYIVSDPSSSAAAIIDPVLDYDPLTQTISTKAADALLDQVISHKYEITYLLETHAHADHLSASSYLQARLHEIQGYRPPIGIGKRIGAVQELFSRRYGVPKEETTGVFDKLFDDDEEFTIGNLKATAIHLPGHTPDHLGYRIGGLFLLCRPFPHLICFLLISSQITSSAVIRSSIPTSEQLDVTSLVEARITCLTRGRSY